MPQRFSESRIDAVERTAAGALRVTATPTRVGVFAYTRPDGSTVRELRAPEEVFHADSLASLEDAAVTVRHPAGGVTPARFRDLAAGHVRAGTVRADAEAGVVRAGLALGRADAIALASADAKPQLSCGYDCAIDPTPGEWKGQRYDQAQTRIRYNHVAILPPGEPGRMGNVCRLDAAGEQITDDAARADASTETLMKIKIGDKTYENEAEAQAAVTALQARADAADAQVRTLTETVARADAERAATEHATLVAKVKGLGIEVSRKDDKGTEVPLTVRELQVAVIKRTDAAFDPTKADDVYIRARFDHAMATSAKAAEVISALNGGGPGTSRTDAAGADKAEALRNKILADARKNGVSVTE